MINFSQYHLYIAFIKFYTLKMKGKFVMKWFSAIVALLLVFSITACSDSTKNNNETQNNTTKTNSVILENEKVSETNRENFYEKTTEKETGNQDIATTGINETTKKPDKNPSETTTQKTADADKPRPTTTKPQTTPTPSKKLPNYTPEAEIVTLFNKINKYREEKGLSKLALDPELCKMAYIRAEEQKVLKGHTRPDNSKYYSILDEYNYSYMGCGENIAFFPDLAPDDIFNKWKGSAEHDANMTESRWTKSGIALYKNADGRYTIVLLFAC